MDKIFDSHLHIIDRRFPLVSNQFYLPPEFTCEEYLKRVHHLNIVGGAVVSGSFQAFDQTYLLAALKELGPSFVGIMQLPATTPDAEIARLNAAGVRGVRFNLVRGGSENVQHLESFAKRLYSMVGWHIELYVDSKELDDLFPLLLKVPLVSIDHLGLSKDGLPTLLSLVEKGVKVKATGFGRVDFDVPSALKEIAKANPDALMFGSDLPSTRAPRSFLDEDIKLIQEVLDPTLAHKALYSNAFQFYHPDWHCYIKQ